MRGRVVEVDLLGRVHVAVVEPLGDLRRCQPATPRHPRHFAPEARRPPQEVGVIDVVDADALERQLLVNLAVAFLLDLFGSALGSVDLGVACGFLGRLELRFVAHPRLPHAGKQAIENGIADRLMEVAAFDLHRQASLQDG